MALTEIKFGSVASSKDLNDNFEYLDERINTTSQNITNLNGTIVSLVNSQINTLNSNINESINKVITRINSVNEVGQPIIRLDNSIYDNEIRLEGAEVSRETYAGLFKKYGVTYGAGNGATTFKLPDFRNRTAWGADSFGYISAGLPNITGTVLGDNGYWGVSANITQSGAFYQTGSTTYGVSGQANGKKLAFDASRCSSIYGKSATVQTPSIKVRWVTRYK